MRNSTKTELRTLREVAHFLLPLVCCEFCGLPLLDPKLADKVFGDKAHTPLKFLKLTTHHRNGKHRDNKGGELLRWNDFELRKLPFKKGLFAISGNKSLVHRPCHGEHEMKLNHHKRKVMKVKPSFERAKVYLRQLHTYKIKPILSESEISFIQNSRIRAAVEKKFTRYELRRLKKLAAKVEKKK